ncbi:MAG: hypothetical protein IPJ57_14130 [Gemmatimonadetes bacterium]|nr:hypothetical protein [Gemmatimonadota bacterium]
MPGGLTVGEVDDASQTKRAFYSVGGLLDSLRMRNGLTTRFRYDAFGRRTAMIYPKRVFQLQERPETPVEWQIPGCCIRVDTIPDDSVSYSYDLLGRITRTANRWGVIRSSYLADGALETRVTDLNTLDGSGNQIHAILDSLRYVYDSAGARTKLIMAGETGLYNAWQDSVLYRYNAQGDLDTLRACFGKADNWQAGLVMPPCRAFRFTWDSLGRRKTITYPNSAVVTSTYDLQDVLVTVAGVKTVYEPPTGKSDRFDFSYGVGYVNAVGRIWSQSYACNDWTQQDLPGLPCGKGGATRQVTNVYNIRGELLRQTTLEGSTFYGDTTRHDIGGNMDRRARWDGGTLQQYTVDNFSTAGASNRLQASSRSDTYTPFDLAYEYDADGARIAQRPTPVTAATVDQDRRWFYDAMGRQAGYKYVEWSQGEARLRSEPRNGCQYDPEGQVFRPCNYGGNLLAYEGVNVSRFANETYRFIHGGGTDDLLMARYSYGSAVEEIYFVTDGQGRELAAADFDGSRNQAVWGDGGHREAGTTTNGSSFDATRMGNADQPGVSLFRNRSYDANSGRWLQEDPIGIAGGVNLYQFNGNNPVAYTDPFGLCPKQDLLCQVFVSGAQALGGAAGFFGGLAEGGLEGLACGPAAPACSPALALTNAVAGAIAIGTAAGKAADAIMSGTEPLQMARAGRGGGNSAENRASNQIKKEYRFTPEGENAFHTEIGRLKKFYDVKSLTEEQLREAADIVRQNAKYIRPPE